MEYQFLIRGTALMTCLILVACIKQIDYEPAEVPSTLVVDGVILAGNGPHTLKLSTTGRLGETTFPPVTNAKVFLFNETTGSKFVYLHVGEGKYFIWEGIFRVKTRENYFIEIVHENKVYRSRPERIPEPQHIKDISYRVEDDQFILEVENTTPDNGMLYLRWELENIYTIDELICHPFAPTHKCYIKDDFHIASIPLLDASLLQAGTTFKYDVATKRINFTFGNPQSFLVTQHSITAEAFDYWSRIDLVSNQLGTIFDPQVASVGGNIYNIKDPADQVLGYFRAIAQDTVVLFTNPGFFFDEFEILPYCGIPGFEIYAPGCCNCIELEDASWAKPDYW